MSSVTAVPDRLRRPAAVVAALAAVAVAALGTRYAGLGTSTRTDQHLDRLVSIWTSPADHRELLLVQMLGNPVPVVAAAGLLAALALASGRRRLAVLAVVGPGLTGLATTALKDLFDRTLTGSPAYPSGHTGALTALAIVAALLLVSLARAGTVAASLLVAVTTLGTGTVMAVALTALDVHYPTDTIGGFGTAVAIVLGTAVVLDRLSDTVRRRRMAEVSR